jgi:Protein of unknown function (DUF2637)
VNGADRAIRVSTAVAVLGVAGIAEYISYWHAYEVVRAHGETGVTARLEPATIDGLVYASSMVVLYAARHQLPAPGLARWLLALGIVATLAANVALGWSHGPIGAAVAAWPAASLVGSYELLLWLIRTAAAAAVARETAGRRAGAPADHTVAELRLVPKLDPEAPECRAASGSHAIVDGLDDGRAGPSKARTGPTGQANPLWTRRTGPGAAQRPTPKLTKLPPLKMSVTRTSTLRRWPLTEPASTVVGRCPNASSPPCSAEPLADGPAIVWLKPIRDS